MSIALSDHFPSLPEEERSRLQKVLKVVLQARNWERWQGKVEQLYQMQGEMQRYLESDAMVRLLDAFGVLSANELCEAEKLELKASPYTIWPDPDHCYLSAEALQLAAQTKFYRKQDYLFSAILRLSPQEICAWFRWLGFTDRLPTRKKRAQLLYNQLACLRAVCEHDPLPEVLPKYLDEVFPDDVAREPMAWFYRGVLPFYDILREIDATGRKLPPDFIRLLQAFRLGKIVLEAEKPNFGEATRFRIIRTREHIGAKPRDELQHMADFRLQGNYLL